MKDGVKEKTQMLTSKRAESKVEYNMTTNELRRSVRFKLEAAIRAQRESWDAALGMQEITGYAGDIYAFVAETAGALKDDEAIPGDLVDDLISSTSMPQLPLRSTSQTPRAQ